ncbi:MAG: dihydrodipicolinate synthase family protein [Chloroflexota bacterium]
MKIIPKRKITAYSAILLPFQASGAVDWGAFCAHVARTHAAGLTPAVNMDTGYVNLISAQARREALRRTQEALDGGRFAAGAYVGDRAGDAFDLLAYSRQIEQVLAYGGTPVIFQSFGLTGLPADRLAAAYAQFGSLAGEFIAFELGGMFAPFGKIYDLDFYAGLLGIPQCIGAKHSSLSRLAEWQRLDLRERLRPDFKVFTGNDLAIDMVMYGSDYLLGLSTFAPDYFALRDHYWLVGDLRFYELNDVLQYLGAFAFRPPTPAYKHSAVQFLKLRGWIDCDEPHPGSPRRPDSDREILAGILESLSKFELSGAP